MLKMYINRHIDISLLEWSKSDNRKPLLLRGARQVGKSSAVEHLGQSFDNFVKIDFERNPEYTTIFKANRDVKRIVSQLTALCGSPITPGKTLLFFDEIQACPEAIMSLRYFREDLPELHVISAGSLLEFALDELPTFGVGRIHSLFMYPLSFDEFLGANGYIDLMELRNKCNFDSPIPDVIHLKLIELFRTYLIIGGMPEVVAQWLNSHDFAKCQQIQDDIIIGYEADFPKYRKRINPKLLQSTFRSAANQIGTKFVYSNVRPGWKTADVKLALDLLYKAGILIPVTRTAANGLPLGAEANDSYRKICLLDTGLLLRLQNISLGNASQTSAFILTAPDTELINKGSVSEMVAGLEMIKYLSPNIRHELFYWIRDKKNAQAEIDYVTSHNNKIIPIEIKAGQKGGMKSLWYFMSEKKIDFAVRCSLENFGHIVTNDSESNRYLAICPIYALSLLPSLI